MSAYTTVLDGFCIENDCGAKLYARNRCKKHYNEFRKWNGGGNLEPITCIQCETVFYVEPYRVNSVETCSKECQSENHSIRMKKPKSQWFCAYCGKYFTPRRREGKYCSKACAIEIFAENARKSVREKNPKWVPHKIFNCSVCDVEFEDRETTDRVVCSHECNNIFAKREAVFECAVCGHQEWMQKSDAERKVTCSRECRTVWIGKSNTSIERAVEGLLQEEGFNYKSQWPLDRMTADFYLPDYYLIIECDGDYWHSLPEVVERDKRRDAFARSQGLSVLRLSETLINSDLESCKNLIYNSISNQRVLIHD